jgi:hypothetical protein
MCCQPSSPSGPAQTAGRGTSIGGACYKLTRFANTTTFRSQARLKRMQCAQNGCHRGTGTGPWQGVRPFSAAAQRTGSLPDAADRYTAQSCTKSNSSSQRALPALWLECRFCLSSPSTNSNPAGTPLNSALVRPSMAEPMQESSTDGRRNAASRKHVQSIVQLSTCCKNKITTRRGRDDAIQKSFRHL